MKHYIVTVKGFKGQLDVNYFPNGAIHTLENTLDMDMAKLGWMLQQCKNEDKLLETCEKTPVVRAKPYNPEVTFQEFYDAYGNKHKKQVAENAWKRLSKKDRVLAYQYIEKYKNKKRMDGTAMAYPATYLNQAVWND